MGHGTLAQDAFARLLVEAGVTYRWEPRLGGRRHLAPDERGADPWWQVEAFGAYAAHTRTTEFTEALTRVLDEVATSTGETAVMCSESLWWRCHRRLISDVTALVRRVPVMHLAHLGRLSDHTPATGARITPQGLRYDQVE